MNDRSLIALAVIAFSVATQLGLLAFSATRGAPVAMGAAVAGSALAWLYSISELWAGDGDLAGPVKYAFFGAVVAMVASYLLAVFGV